ncbi:DMT family transporter [Tabrizicola sp. J26]|uniref:DMT family transporter n=1 Tax=Alitabrizicola rongguiensis TaxID=2909234 RepID=UPI001F2EFCE0|nr:DMT family transporter [Tabrizicola rongguiensis]MCF1709789.1 DMT family transporter [Tabrizicola rongguiensis]
MTPQKSISARAWAELLLLAMIWGGSFIANRLAINEIGVLGTVAFRVAGACALLWLYVALRGLTVPRSPRIWGAFLLMGALNNAIPFSLITWAQLTVPSGLAAILNASTALMGVVVASVVFRDERLTGRRLAGVLLGLAGVTVVIGLQALTALDLTSVAQLTLLVAALSYACAAVWGRLNLSGLPPQVAAAGMLTGSTLLMLPAALLVEGVPPGPSAGTWLALGYLAVVSTAGAYLLYYRVLALAGAGNLSLVTLLTAPFAVILGALVLGESLPLRDYLGFALIAAGLVVIDGRILNLAKIPREIQPPVR